MSDDFRQLKERIIGAAFKVQNTLGPGLLESVYENAMAVELELQGIPFERQVNTDLFYEGVCVGSHRLDLIAWPDRKPGVRGLVVELKACDPHDRHLDQLRTYVKSVGAQGGVLLGFSRKRVLVRAVTPVRDDDGPR